MEVRAETSLLASATGKSLVILVRIEGGQSPNGVSSIEDEKGGNRDGEYG